jgi:hypothetical protein
LVKTKLTPKHGQSKRVSVPHGISLLESASIDASHPSRKPDDPAKATGAARFVA